MKRQLRHTTTHLGLKVNLQNLHPNLTKAPVTLTVIHTKSEASIFLALCVTHSGSFMQVVLPSERRADIKPGLVIRLSPPW
jgi:hypothetical protein